MRCSNCDHENPLEAKFCMECGRDVAAHDAAASRGRSPLEVTPPHLVEKIRKAGADLVGEHKQVTVLFADVAGSMELQEGVDPETWHAILDRFFTIMCEGVSRFEGTVNKFTGDGIMALFGAPIAHEDHAQRACYAALHLAGALAPYALELRREQGLNFHVRMGLNSGEVVVGAIGADLRMDYTALGHTVGLASRIEQLAEPGKAYLTEKTAELASGFFELDDLGEFTIKGVRKPVRVYELSGVGAARSRLDISRARGFSRFVGRDREMESLEEALARTMEGDGRVVGVVAGPGVGKSRLCFEFAERCRARAITVREARGVSHGKGIPFLPVLELLRAFFEITDADPDEKAREKVAGRLVLLDPGIQEWLPLLFEFMGIADPDNPPARMDPEARMRRLLEMVKSIVHARSRKETSVLILEDLHWIDPGSEAFLSSLVEAVPGTRSLVVANFRPEYRSTWMDLPQNRSIDLEPLGASAIEHLLDDLLGNDASVAEAADRIRDRTGGNPFFIEEVVQALAESGSLVGTRGAYKLGRPVDENLVPPTVEAVLAARIDRLGDREKSLLQTAAVIGREFSEPVLQRVAGLDKEDLGRALAALVGAEFLYEVALYPEAGYTFKHPLSQEVAYRSQLGEHRAGVHRAVAQALVALYPDKLEERAALISHHFEAAGEALEAARWSATAASWAGRSNHAEAYRHWMRVRSLLGGLESNDDTEFLTLLACVQAGAHGWRLGIKPEEAHEIVLKGSAIAERRNDLASLTLLTMLHGGITALAGGVQEGYELALEADRIAERAGDPLLRLIGGPALSYLGFQAGRLDDALAVQERLLADPPADPMLGADLLYYSPYIFVLMAHGFLLPFLGRPLEAVGHLERALQLARDHGDLEVVGWTHGAFSLVARFTGERSYLGSHSEQAVVIAERIGSSFSQVIAYATHGNALTLREEWGPAEEALRHAIEIARERGVGIELTAWTLSRVAECYLATGDPRARETAEESVAEALRFGTKTYEIEAHHVLGRILLAEGSTELARAAFHEALEAIRGTGAASYEPLVREDLAALAAHIGDTAEHARELRLAHRLYTEIGATGHLARLDPLVSALS